MASNYVCATCGLSCGVWGNKAGYYWKHQNGGYGAAKTCGKAPVPMKREVYEQRQAAAIQTSLRR